MRRPGVPRAPRSDDRGASPKPENPRRSFANAGERADSSRRTSKSETRRAKARRAAQSQTHSSAPDRYSRAFDPGGERPAGATRGKKPRDEAKSDKPKRTQKLRLFGKRNRAQDAAHQEAAQSERRRAELERSANPLQMRRYFTPKRASATFGAADDSIELDAHRGEAKRARRRAIWARVAIGALALVVVVAIAWGIFFSPFFALTASKIEISGAGEEVPESEVEQVLTQFQGVPITRVSMGTVEDAVLSIPQVQSVSAERAWPDGLKVSIKARTPFAAVPTDGGFDLLDREGVRLRTVPDVPEGLVVATLNAESDEERASAMASIATVHEALTPKLTEQIQTYIASSLNLEMRTTDGRVIKWGDATQSELKAEVVLLLLEQRPAQVYDVSTPARPVTS